MNRAQAVIGCRSITHPGGFLYGKFLAEHTLLFVYAMCYSCLAPLILPAGFGGSSIVSCRLVVWAWCACGLTDPGRDRASVYRQPNRRLTADTIIPQHKPSLLRGLLPRLQAAAPLRLRAGVRDGRCVSFIVA